MAADFGTGKTLVVLSIVLGCFAILWPKIFYPMMQTAFAMTSPNIDADGRIRSDNADRPPHLHPSSSNNPRIRGVAGTQQEDIQDKFLMREGRPFPNPASRQPPKPEAKTGGAMSIIMPIYTVGIVVFFLYTVLKLVFKKPNEGEKKPLIKDFHMDPEYHKFVCQQPTGDPPKPGKGEKSHKKHSKVFEKIVEEVEEDYEIYKLRKKLEETENAMEHIIKNMGDVTQKVAQQVEKKVSRGGEVRQRHKGRKKEKEAETTRHIEEVSDDEMATLEEDLTELIGMCRATTNRAAERDKSEGSSAEEGSSDGAMHESEEEEVDNNDTRRLGKTVKVA
ncbi:hypothetical protein JTE90_013499 [Oedothorax gibbosus]|uniref:Resistance to inhibitors of cholinesterase protein 3 N-terminal domain-containing protein n=1 Tax=Oedothorax gibbosus TaxID=931172 RepID=A0AAV6VMQ4_9ARAC|nr:hypothetical protein JTE90_013499 [Oedothorax gibbosus]